MIKKLITLIIVLWAFPALAQWQVPTNTIPYGKGSGKVGFGSITNSGSGALCLLNTAPPTFGACPSSITFPISITSCGAIGDSSTDNTSAIQTCFNANTAIIIPAAAGAFCARALTIPTTLKLILIEGELRACGSITAFTAFLRAASPNPLTITGFGTINVNSTTYSTVGVIDIVTGQDVTISGLYINEGGRFPLQIEGCSNCTFTGISARNYTQSAASITDCISCLLSGSQFTATNSVTVNVDVNGGNDVTVTGNLVYGGAGFGISAQATLRPTISNNHVRDTVLEGIAVGQTTTYAQVLNNNVSWNGSVSTDFGMSQAGTDGTHQTKFNLWSGNTVTNSGKGCLGISSDSVYTTIIGNDFVDCNRLVDATNGSAVNIDGPRTTYTWVKSNTCTSTSSVNITNCVKELSNADYTFVDGNNYLNISSTPIVLNGSGGNSRDYQSGVPSTPAVVCGTGTLTAAVKSARSFESGWVSIAGTITVTTAGTCNANNVQMTLPITASGTYGGGLTGQNVTNGVTMIGAIAPGFPTIVTFVTSSGAGFPVTGNTQTLVFSGGYFAP